MSVFEAVGASLLTSGVSESLTVVTNDGRRLDTKGIFEAKEIGREKGVGRAKVLSEIPIVTLRDGALDYRKCKLELRGKTYSITSDIRDGYGFVQLSLRECAGEQEED